MKSIDRPSGGWIGRGGHKRTGDLIREAVAATIRRVNGWLGFISIMLRKGFLEEQPSFAQSNSLVHKLTNTVE